MASRTLIEQAAEPMVFVPWKSGMKDQTGPWSEEHNVNDEHL